MSNQQGWTYIGFPPSEAEKTARRRLKAQAALQGKPFYKVVIEAMVEYCDKREKDRPVPAEELFALIEKRRAEKGEG